LVKPLHISLICGGLLAGVALGRAGFAAGLPMLGAAAVAAVLAWRTRLLPVALALVAISLGLLRADAWKGEQAVLTARIGSQVALVGTVIDDPALTGKGQVNFTLGDLRDHGAALSGAIAVHEPTAHLQRGYQVQVSGKLKPGFGPVPAELSFPKLEVLSSTQTPLERLRQRFFAGMHNALPDPMASFGLGLLVGIRALIPKDMQATLALVGLSHLVAVSGYNLTILVSAAERATRRFGRRTALASSLWLIGGFLVVTGASASIVRASLVSVLSLLAAFYGRRFHPLALILIAAGATAAYDPKFLTDLGWLLSFLAFFGILVLAPAIEARLGHPKRVVARLFIESFAAQLLTIPLILYFFSQLSIVSPITNLLILPMVPLAMGLSFVAGLAGMLLPAFAGWFAWPAATLLSFMINLINAFAALPFAGRQYQISLGAMLAMYALIAALTLALTRATRSRADSVKPQSDIIASWQAKLSL
jgi:competence protein ComEC